MTPSEPLVKEGTRSGGICGFSSPDSRSLCWLLATGILVALTLLCPASLRANGEVPDHRDLAGDGCSQCHRAIGAATDFHALLPNTPHDSFTCLQCHELHGTTSNLHLIREEIDTPNSGVRAVVFLNHTGANSFADGDDVYDGVCEVCHTATFYHRNNPSGDHTHNVGADCTSCHPHDANFQPEGGSCLDCHNRTQPHNEGDYRRQVVEQNGDGGGDFVRVSHHVTDGTQDQIVTEGDCVVCHDQSNHRSYGDGVSVFLNDPAGGASILYDGSAISLEGFCSSCHDGAHTAPFSDGQPAPELPAGWGGSPHESSGVTCYGDGEATGCHANGHGADYPSLLQRECSLQDYTNYSTQAYDLCWLCHSEQAIIDNDNAFEDLHRKHVRNEDAPCVSCHNLHAPFDDGEPGLISFAYAVANGMDFELIDGVDLSGAFWVSEDGSRGYCYLRCHGKEHHPKHYNRTPHADPPHSTGDDGEGGAAQDVVVRRIQGFPVPTRGEVTIELLSNSLGVPATVTAVVYDLAGRVVRRFPAVIQPSGTTQIRWDGLDAAGRPVRAGVYLCRVGSGKGERICRLVVVR